MLKRYKHLTQRHCTKMSSVALKPANFDIKKIKYGAPKTLDTGARIVGVYYGDGKLNIQLPWLRIPYGVGTGYKKEGEEDKPIDRYDLNISFIGQDTNPKVKETVEIIESIQNKIINDAFDNRVTWLHNDYKGNKGFVEMLCSPTIKYDKDKATGQVTNKYPPTMKLKLPYDAKNDNFTFDAEDNEGNEIDFKTLMKKLKGAKVRPIIQMTGIWIAGGKYGCSWKIIRAQFEVSSQNKVAFADDSDDDTEKKESKVEEHDLDLEEDALAAAQNTPSPVKSIEDKLKQTQIEESEEEADEAEAEGEDSDEDEPPPPPPPKEEKKKSSSTKKK